MTIYSADFTIVVRGDSIPDFRSPLGSFSNSSSTTGLVSTYAGLATASQPSSPPPSPPLPSVSVSEAESPEPTSIAIPPLHPSDVGNTTQPSPAGKNKNSAPGGLDTEKLKFRLVFILWPAVLGITLAL
jgi:hypothetical protein